MGKFKAKLYQFMMGRRGPDQFSRFLIIVTLIVLLASTFTRIAALYYLAIILLIYTYFRIFSRNIYKRETENNKYLTLTYNLRKHFLIKKQRKENRSSYVYFKCPKCKTEMKAPRGKGKIQVNCHNCGNVFIKKV